MDFKHVHVDIKTAKTTSTNGQTCPSVAVVVVSCSISSIYTSSIHVYLNRVNTCNEPYQNGFNFNINVREKKNISKFVFFSVEQLS